MSDLPPPVSPTSPRRGASPQDLIRFESEKKSAGIAFLLCWVFGAFGAHRFYLRKPQAVTMLVISLISLPLCFVFIGFIGLGATWVWTIIDLFSVSGWVRAYNSAILARIEATPGGS